jgi:tetratricopeptide (TPR) repeat protein
VIDLLAEVVLEPEFDTIRGNAFMKTGRPDEAFESFEEALREDERHVPAYIGQIRIMLVKNEVLKAGELLEKVTVFPDSLVQPYNEELESLRKQIEKRTAKLNTKNKL